MTNTNFGILEGSRKPQTMLLLESKPVKHVAIKLEPTPDSIDAIRELLNASEVQTFQYSKKVKVSGTIGTYKDERTIRVLYTGLEDTDINSFNRLSVDEGHWVVKVLEGDDEGRIYTTDDARLFTLFTNTGKTTI